MPTKQKHFERWRSEAIFDHKPVLLWKGIATLDDAHLARGRLSAYFALSCAGIGGLLVRWLTLMALTYLPQDAMLYRLLVTISELQVSPLSDSDMPAVLTGQIFAGATERSNLLGGSSCSTRPRCLVLAKARKTGLPELVSVHSLAVDKRELRDVQEFVGKHSYGATGTSGRWLCTRLLTHTSQHLEVGQRLRASCSNNGCFALDESAASGFENYQLQVWNPR